MNNSSSTGCGDALMSFCQLNSTQISRGVDCRRVPRSQIPVWVWFARYNFNYFLLVDTHQVNFDASRYVYLINKKFGLAVRTLIRSNYLEVLKTDVVIVGAEGTGLRAAIAGVGADPSLIAALVW